MFDTLKIINETAAFNRWAGFEVVRADKGEAELRMLRQHGPAYNLFLIC